MVLRWVITNRQLTTSSVKLWYRGDNFNSTKQGLTITRAGAVVWFLFVALGVLHLEIQWTLKAISRSVAALLQILPHMVKRKVKKMHYKYVLFAS